MHDFAQMIRERVLPGYTQCLAVKGVVFVKVFCSIHKYLPLVLVVPAVGNSDKLRVEDPVDQIILIFEVVIEALAVHIT